MKNLKILLFMLLLAPTMLFAQTDVVGPALSENIILLLTPFVVLGVTALIKYFTPKIPGIYTLIIVAVLSTAVAWVSEITISDGSSFWVQIGAGLLSVFINQLYKQYTSND